MARLNDTIAAVATAAGRGAIGIVRISGVDLGAIATRLVGTLPPPRVVSNRTVRDAYGNAIDTAIVLYFAAPKSFTGEDVLEIQTHGGNVVTRDVLEAAYAAGARPAAAGEFSERAFLNGKIDLIQAEAIADLIESATSRAARLARNSLAGRFSDEVVAIAEELKSIRVQLEGTIDFADEDMSPDSFEKLEQRSTAIGDQLLQLIAKAVHGVKLNNGLDIAIVGRPNVGKSTLLNALAGEDRAIVSDEPGTTRDVLSMDLEIGGVLVRIHDTAGLRDANNAVEREGVRRAKLTIDQSDAVFYVVTSQSDPLSDYVAGLTVPIFTIRNKIDLDSLSASVEPRPEGAYIQISARYGCGLDLLRTTLLDHFDLAGESDNTFLARDRHLNALRCALEALDFDHAQRYCDAPELGAERLRRAGYELGTLTGEYSSEDLLGDIFSTFCIGK